MKKYEFTSIEINTGGAGDDIIIVSTNEEVIRWATEQIKKLHPTTQVKDDIFYEKLPQAVNLCRLFRKMDYRQHAVGLCLIQELCQSGWEPFGKVDFLSPRLERITLRRCTD